MLTQAPKGTKDILPRDTHKWNFVESVFREICERRGFAEIRTPVFEYTELFSRGVGETTDIVQKQMYSFADYDGRGLTLRPEGTASVARAFLEHKLYAEPQPSKFAYEISCYRHERQQKGRQREFHQFGVECFGSADMLADAEVIALAADFFAALGVRGVELRVNSIGCPACRGGHREALRAFLSPKRDALCDTCKTRFDRNPMRILDCKSPVCGELVKGAPSMLDYLCDACREDFAALRRNLDALGIAFEVDAGIVRGLDYYTKTAFEFVSNRIGAQGTVCGGGRYDHLIEELGGPPTPGVGFGLGIERLLLLMEAEDARIPPAKGADAYIAYLGEGAKLAGLGLLRRLRAAGLRAEMDGPARNLKGQLKRADRLGARFAIVIGEEELAANAALLKDMVSGEQRRVARDEILSALAADFRERKE
ncbi:MAG: histidine--tRNA ligase [Clostridiales Family XIII bacterium]|jgi:histidyl-tRNA synthetase|nr:histidine--tRNA ligase [Clostridiales Family XIII bacterium]